jgi:hypothetical protein
MATPPRACTPANAESPALIEGFGEALEVQAAKANVRCTIELLRIEPPIRSIHYEGPHDLSPDPMTISR